MTKNLTDWFPSRIKPVRKGVYETKLDCHPDICGYALWNGWRWGNTFSLIRYAYEDPTVGMQDKIWRGLKEKA